MKKHRRKKPEARRVLIDCGRDQALIIVKALDLYSRLLAGDMHELDNLLAWETNRCLRKRFDRQLAGIYLRKFKEIWFPELAEHGHYGVMQKEVPVRARHAYEMLKWIEHAMFKDDPDCGPCLRQLPLDTTNMPKIGVATCCRVESR
jgi:hypothetical protein